MSKDLRSKKINQIMYISIGCVIALIILFVTLFMALNKNKNNEKIDLQIGSTQNNNSEESEEASSSIGNKVGETDEYQEVGKVDNANQQNTNNINANEQSNGNTSSASGNSDSSENAKNKANSGIDDNKNENSGVNVNTNSNVDGRSTSQNSDTNSNVNSTMTNQNNINSANSQSDISDTEEVAEDPTFVMPVDGEIMKQYGKDKLIYSDTLKEWTTHLGIDIKADKTTIVKASSDGIVKSIKNDPRYGLTIVIEHENGFSSVYSNLLTAEFVVADEEVKSGQTIGTVGNSATFEILDDAHLHFEILKDGKSVDPQMYIK